MKYGIVSISLPAKKHELWPGCVPGHFCRENVIEEQQKRNAAVRFMIKSKRQKMS